MYCHHGKTISPVLAKLPLRLTPSSARAFCASLEVLRVIVREMTLRHFFPSLLPLFIGSSGAPATCHGSNETLSFEAEGTDASKTISSISSEFKDSFKRAETFAVSTVWLRKLFAWLLLRTSCLWAAVIWALCNTFQSYFRYSLLVSQL